MSHFVENYERLFNQVASYVQPAKKNYNIENIKHITMKLIQFCAKGEGKIVVFGDKDVDGIFSSMIMAVYLRRLMQIYQEKKFLADEIGVDIRYSNREKDGFGLSFDTYEALSEKYGLIVTTDNGTSATFHSYSINNLVVIDHHPLNEGEEIPEVPYVLNPNVWRTDGLEYSTSGGMVAYDLVRFINQVLKEQDKHYKKYLTHPDNHYRHERMLEVLKEFAGFTVISDMAELDKNNRHFVIEAFQSAFLKKDVVPLYSLFGGEFTQEKLSFGINPMINIDRMGELHTINKKTGKTYMESFIQPTTKEEWVQAYTFISDTNERRKKIVTREKNKVLSEIDKDAPVLIAMCKGDDVRIGLGGLIANKLAQEFRKPAIIGIETSDKSKLSFSARGDNVKKILSSLLPHTGGHSNACGGSINIQQGQSSTNVFKDVREKLSHVVYKSDAKIKVIHDVLKPLSWKEASLILKSYQKASKGVETIVPMTVAVKGFYVSGDARKGKEWGKIGLSDENKQYRDDALHNFYELPASTLQQAEILIVQLGASGSFSVKATFDDTASYIENTIQHELCVPYGVASEIYDLNVSQTMPSEELIPLLQEKDLLSSAIFYYQEEEVFSNAILSDGLIILPSMVNDRHAMRNRKDTLEFYISVDADTPLSENEQKKGIAEFGTILYTKVKQENIQTIFIKDALLNNPLISGNNKKLMQTIFKSVNALIEKNNLQKIEEENTHEAQNNIIP